jgi:hypothetical protein
MGILTAFCGMIDPYLFLFFNKKASAHVCLAVYSPGDKVYHELFHIHAPQPVLMLHHTFACGLFFEDDALCK